MDEEQDVEEENPLPDGTYAIILSSKSQEEFECVADWDVSALEPQKILSLEKIKQNLKDHGEESDFFQIQDHVQKSKLDEPLLIYDATLTYGADYLLCLNGESKYGYLQGLEETNMRLVDDDVPYEYIPPVPKAWASLKSDIEIEKDLVTDSRPKIRLQIKRVVPREDKPVRFQTRDVDEAPDGYVACESQQDPRVFQTIQSMEHAMQAVPLLVHRASQTELKHPKNMYTQYEPRVFSEEEVEEIAKSQPMVKFLSKVVDVFNEVIGEPDIMGDLRGAIECFYLRDHVEIVEEVNLKELTFFADINYTNAMRVTHLRWHPKIKGVLAMSVIANTDYTGYLENLTKRLVMPTMLMIWSMAHPLFPQILLRVCDDVAKFEWHPLEQDILIGGCMNGQVMIWDIGQYLPKLRAEISIWDHDVVMEDQGEKLHIHDGFIPVVYWSAESRLEFSHSSPIEDLQWLPSTVWFSHESAYPKQNPKETNRQFITCSSDFYILVWDLKKPPTEDGVQIEDPYEDHEEEGGLSKFKGKAWDKLRTQSNITTVSLGSDKKWSPASGRYKFLNKIWKPVHKICFLDPKPKMVALPGQQAQVQQDPLLKILITSLSVTARPDLMMVRRETTKVKKSNQPKEKREQRPPSADDGPDREDGASSISSKDARRAEGSISSETEEEDAPPDPTQQALPTLLMAGTIWGSIFRADLSKNRVDVETNNLLCTIEWITPVHDGPVRMMAKNPFMPHLLLSVGGYSFAVWNEGVMNKPVILHFVHDEQFTNAAWSLTQPSIVFFSSEKGNIQVWDITKRRSEPFQVQNIAGKPITAVCPYDQQYLSVADDSGVLRVMQLPKHLWTVNDSSLDLLQSFIDSEIAKKEEKERLQKERQRYTMGSTAKKMTWEEELKEDTKIEDTEEEFLKFYFFRERQVMEKVFGNDWKKHLKHPDLPRDEYQITETEIKDESSTSSMSSSRKQSIISGLSAKTKGIALTLMVKGGGGSDMS